MTFSRRAGSTLVPVLWLVLVGCRELPQRTPPSIHMIPLEAKLVGGGLDIDFTAPESGIVFLFDWEERKTVLSKSLRKSESVTIRKGADVATSGIAVALAPGLYFVAERDLKLGDPTAAPVLSGTPAVPFAESKSPAGEAKP